MTLALAAAGCANAAGSLPTYSGVGSNVTVTPSGSAETVTVSSSRAYAEWSDFNVAAGSTFKVAGQNTNWILVNKVTGGTGSTISGTVTAPGQVWIIDPNGVTVNAGAAINVGGLLLSSAAWTDTDKANFLASTGAHPTWGFTGATGPIVMNGTIQASGGVVALLGPSVTVGATGTVTGAAHTQFLAVAAKDVSLTFADDGTYFTLDGVTINRGAAGGQVQLSSGSAITADRIVVASAGATSAASIVVGGSLTATQARSDGTDIVLLAADASPTAQTLISGGAVQALVSGASQGQLTLQSGATLATSAASGGLYAAANGGVALDVAAVSTSGSQTWAGPVTLGMAATLKGSSVGFRSTVNGAYGLTVLGDAAFGGAVGVTTNLASLSVSGTTALSGGTVTTTGAQTYSGAVTLGATTTLTASQATFGLTLDGGYGLTVTGNAEFDRAVGVATNLASLSVSGTTALKGGVVTTTGAQTYAGAVTLGAASTLTSSKATFDTTLDGGYGLTVTGNAEFDGPVGVGSLSVSGTTALSAATVTTTGTQSYGGGVTLGSAATLTATKATFGSTLDGGYGLTVTGNAEFDGAVGVGLLSVSGTTVLSAGTVTTTGTQSYEGGLTLGSAATLTASKATFGSTLNGGYGLTVTGNAEFDGPVGVGSLSVSGTSALSAGTVTTTGTQGYGGGVTLGSTTTLAASKATFGSTLDGGYGLTVTGNAEFDGPVGVGSLSVSGTTALSAGTVTTTGTQGYGGGVTLGSTTTLAASKATFGLTLDGGYGLTVTGNAEFDGPVGSAAKLASLSVSGTTALKGGPVTATGPQTYTGPVTLGADATLTGSAVSFGSTTDGAHGLTVDATGQASFTGAVGGGAPLASLQVSAGSISLSGAVQTSGELSLTSLASGLTVQSRLGSSGGDVSIAAEGGVLALAADVDAGAGNVTLTASGAMTQTSGVITAGQLSGSAGAGVVLDDANAVGSLSNFTAPTSFSFVNATGFSAAGVSGAASLSLTASTGDLTLAGDVSGVNTTLVATTGAILQTGGKITATTLGGSAGTDVMLNQPNAVSQISGFNAPSGLSFTNSGALTVAGVDGGTGVILATNAGGLTLSGDVSGTQATLTASGGAIDQTGGVLTTQSLTASSVGGASLAQTNNRIGAIQSFTNTGGGDLVIADGQRLALGQISNADATGSVQISSTGAITESGGRITAGQDLVLTAATNLDLTDAPSVGRDYTVTAASFSGLALAPVFASGRDFTIDALGPLTLPFRVSAPRNLTIQTEGDLTLDASVSAGETLTLSSGGAILQTSGAIAAATLTGSSTGATALPGANNQIGTLAGFKAGGDFTLSDAQPLAVTVALTAGAAGSGDLSLMVSGNLTLGADLTASGAGTLTLSSTRSSISQTGGTITAGTLTGGAATSATLDDANAVGTLSGFTATTGLSFVNATGFTASVVQGGSSASLTANTGDLTLAGNISGGTTTLKAGGAITQTGGVVTATTLGGSAGTSVTLDEANVVGGLSGFTATTGVSFVNSRGFTAAGVDGGSFTSLTANAGDLTLTGDVSGGTTTLKAAGAIDQTDGAVTAATLTGSAGTSASLGKANAVGILSGFTAPGGIVFVNATGFTATRVLGGASTSLTANTGDLTLAGDVSGTTTTLNALTGSITQTGGIITAGTLTGSAGASATLTRANSVQNLSGFTASTGLAFADANGFSAANIDGGTSTTLTAATGQLTLSGDIAGSSVALTASGGPIFQAGGSLTTGILTGSSLGATKLSDANRIVSLGAFTTYGPGADFTLVNAQTLTVTGPLVVGATAAGAGEGNLSLTTTAGALNLDGNLIATADASGTGGIVSLSAAAGITTGDPPSIAALDINVSNQFGSVFLGDLVAQRDIAVSSGTGSVEINSASAGGNIVLRAPGDIIVWGGLSATGSLTGSGAGQMLFASDPTTLGGVAFNLAGSNVDLKAGGSISVGGATTAATDARFQAGGSIAVANVTAGRDIVLDAAGTGPPSPPGDGPPPAGEPPPGQVIVSTGALTATAGDIAVSSGTGSVEIDSASAGGNIVLRAPGDIIVWNGLNATGSLTGSGAGQMLFASAPTTLGGVAFNLAGSNVDLKAGGSISVGGATTAATDARLQAGGSIAVADVTAGRDIVLDAAGTAPPSPPGDGPPPGEDAGDGVTTGALTATGRDIAVLAETGSAAIASASAGDDVAIRAAGSVTVTGALTAGGSGGADGTGAADRLIGASPSAPIAFGGAVYSNLGQGADVDVKAGWSLAGDQSPGASITVGAATSAGRDARFQATGAVDLVDVAVGQDVEADGASVAAGALSAANGDVALQASGGVRIASASAGDAIVISSGGVTSVSGSLTAAGAGTGDSRPRAGEALADTVLGLASGLQVTGDVVIAAPNVQLGPVSAANGDVLLFARPSGASARVTYLGGTASSDAQEDFILDQAEIAGISARSLNVFAGLTAAGSGDVSIGALNLAQSLPILRVYTGGAGSRVDVFGPVTGAPGSSLVIGDTQLRGELKAPSSAILALSQGWTPNVIRVEGTIGGLGAGQAFDQVSLSAHNIYIAPVETGLDFETAVQTTRPEALPVYTGSMTYQISTANLQLGASGPGVIYQRNLARNPSDLAAGVGLSVGKITIATIAPTDAPPSQIALFGVLSPHGTPLNGLSAALSLTFSSQSGAGAPVRFTPSPETINLYRFSTCAFGGGACFINVPPIYVPPLPVTNHVGDLSDHFAPTDEEPVTNSGGEIAWPTGSSDKSGRGPS